MFGVEQAFRRCQLEDMDVFVQFPTVGQRALTQLSFGFRKRDVQRALAGSSAGHQKMQGNGGFAGTGFTLQQKNVSAGQATGQDVIQTLDTGSGLCAEQLVRCRQKSPLMTRGSEAAGLKCLLGLPDHLTLCHHGGSTLFAVLAYFGLYRVVSYSGLRALASCWVCRIVEAKQ